MLGGSGKPVSPVWCGHHSHTRMSILRYANRAVAYCNMFRFSRRLQLDKVLGTAYRFEAAEFSAEAETKEQAEKEVQEWIESYIAGKKKDIVSAEPFKGNEFSKKRTTTP